MVLENIPTEKDILQATENITPYTHRTPVFTSTQLNELFDTRLYFKCENLQKVGAFKMRGASNALTYLTKEERKKGVATHSSGNHAQALALSAKLFKVPAYIVMPENAPAVKVEAVKKYGAKIIFCPPTLKDRELYLEKVIRDTGATFVPPYNDYHIIAGQATAAKELLEDTTDLKYILAPVGGGGLLAGTALSAHYFGHDISVLGTEPEGADDAYRSFLSQKLIPQEDPNTIADGLRTSVGKLNFPIIQQYVQEILTVSDTEIVEAMKLIFQYLKLVVEPSAAVPLAAFIKNKEMFNHEKVGIILSGGNVDLAKLPF